MRSNVVWQLVGWNRVKELTLLSGGRGTTSESWYLQNYWRKRCLLNHFWDSHLMAHYNMPSLSLTYCGLKISHKRLSRLDSASELNICAAHKTHLNIFEIRLHSGDHPLEENILRNKVHKSYILFYYKTWRFSRFKSFSKVIIFWDK